MVRQQNNPVRLTAEGLAQCYYEALDDFIQLRDFQPSQLVGALAADVEAQKASGTAVSEHMYSRLVLARCVENFADIDATLRSKFAGDQYDYDQAINQLFQLCLKLYPMVALDDVCLRADDSSQPALDALRHRTDDKLRGRLLNLNTALRNDVISQNEAVGQAATAIRVELAARVNRGPIAVLFLVGPTGVGKTELAKAIQRHLFGSGSDENLFTINCPEYSGRHEVAKLIGAPPGYISHGIPSLIQQRMEKIPHRVVLFDEIEKGHRTLHNILLQILDEGKLTTGAGAEVNFKESVVVLTSNVGATDIDAARLNHRINGKDGNALDPAAIASIIERALGQQFNPEFIRRITVIPFRAFTRDDCIAVAKRILQRYEAVLLKDSRLTVHFDRALVEHTIPKRYNSTQGASGVDKLLKAAILDPFREWLLTPAGLQVAPADGQALHVTLDTKGKLVVTEQAAPARSRATRGGPNFPLESRAFDALIIPSAAVKRATIHQMPNQATQ